MIASTNMDFRKALTFALVLGIFTLSITLLTDWFLLDRIVNSRIGQELALRNGTDSWNRWIESPIPIYLKIYIFTVTNPDEVNLGGKPKLIEKGPYVYKETRRKTPFYINTLEDSVEYQQDITYIFDKNVSYPLDENDVLTVVNPALVGVTNILNDIKGLQSMMRIFMELAVPPIFNSPNSIFINATVRDLLFSGIKIDCQRSDKNIAVFSMCSALRHMMPIKVLQMGSNGDFSMAILRHRQSLGTFSINAGNKDPSALGEILRWNKKTDMSLWSGKRCNEIGGNDVTLLPPFIHKQSQLRVFSTDICSVVPLVYKEDIYYEGVKGLRFTPSWLFLADDVLVNEDASCYCNGTINGLTQPTTCAPKGAVDISNCMDVPVIMTKPHFLDAANDLLDDVDGLKPDPELHNSYFDIEPKTGIPLEGYQRIQVNLKLNQITTMTLMKDLRNLTFPLLWVEEGTQLGPEEIDKLNELIIEQLLIINIVKWSILTTSTSIIIITSLFMCKLSKSNMKQKV
ncbi:sensory neuron membrane protein 2 [Nilaparvata lugens]|uniref:sensory neuron membrane protein 2 n=1 Tax=Nilaparvata lugens TaxID=108931 RepID=UPI00193CB39E|nr:sensory neuron membrane protein 2 [Nilaparvata lugens]